MRRHLNGPHADRIVKGIDTICSERYRDRKSKFKDKWFVEREGYEHPDAIRSYPPPEMLEEEWNKFVDFCLSEQYMKRSASNAICRSKQKYASRHGTKSYARRIHERQDTSSPLGYIENFHDMHTVKDKWDSPLAKQQYEEMKQISETAGDMNEKEIMEQVLGARRGHSRGIGRKLSFTSSPSSSNVSSTGPTRKGGVAPEVQQYMSMCFQALKASNPNMVIPNIPGFNDESEEGDENEDEEAENEEDDD